LRTRGRISEAWLALGFASVASLVSGSARADVSGADTAAAQALFDQAKQLMAAGRFADACAKFEESQRLDPTSGTLINLANCYDSEGRLVAAWSTFLDAAASANRSGHTEREKAARARAAALAPRLSKIVVDVAAGREIVGMEVRRDGILVGKAQWGAPIPADRGVHRVIVSAPGHKTWEQAVAIKSGGQTVTVEIPLLEYASTSAPATASTPASPEPPNGGGERQPSGRMSTQKTVGLAIGGVGAVGVLVGSVYGFKSMSKRDEAATHCDPGCHDQTGMDLKGEAKSAGDVSTAAFVTGALGLAAGAVLWFTAGSGDSRASAPQVGIGPSGIVVKGAW
jgi:hypothetical protein